MVEWLGGPKDGEVFRVPDGTRYIRLALPLPTETEARDLDPVLDLGVATWHVPIARRAGRHVAVWPGRPQ